MTAKTTDLYDEVRYPAFAYVNTHPGRLAAMAMLHGLSPAPVHRCRVLEIGCNEGANLLPMAYALPESEFVGFDLAESTIERGRQRMQALGLTNVCLLQADILDAAALPELAGEFDYIIAHGLYSWVPDVVRDRLLNLCRDRLSPNGVAFVSYSAKPGGYVRLMLRDILLRRHAEPMHAASQVLESLDLLRLVIQGRPEHDGFRVLLERELHNAEKRGADVVFHDELSPAYAPVSFSTFAAHTAKHGLQFVSEAEFPGPVDPMFKQDIMLQIEALVGDDAIAKEDMLDLIRMRMYRESLLCRAERPVSREARLDAFGQLYFRCAATAEPGDTGDARIYRSAGGVKIESRHAITVALLDLLIARLPEAVSFAEVVEHLRAEGLAPDQEFGALLLRLVISRMIEMEAWQPPVARQVSERPAASRICRQDAAEGTNLTTLFHRSLTMTDPIGLELVRLMDGTRTRDDLVAALSAALPQVPLATLAEGLEASLTTLWKSGTLVDAEALNACKARLT